MPGSVPLIRKRQRDSKSQLRPRLTASRLIVTRRSGSHLWICQVKRIHEYKRQLLNALRIVILYNRLRAKPDLQMPPRVFFFAGKAAPAYHLAKLIINSISNLSAVIDADPAVAPAGSKSLFLPEYSVSLAERLIPASDVSKQISTRRLV